MHFNQTQSFSASLLLYSRYVALFARRSYIELDLPLLIDAAFAAGAAMISFGAVLGKVSPSQLTWLLVLQVPLYALNAYLATEARPSTPRVLHVTRSGAGA